MRTEKEIIIHALKTSDAVTKNWAFMKPSIDYYMICGPMLKHGHVYKDVEPPKPYEKIVGGEVYEGAVEVDDDISITVMEMVELIRRITKILEK